MFNQDMVLQRMESLQHPNGAFIAAPTRDYSWLWLRDHLYMTYTYYYLGHFVNKNYYEKLNQGVRIAFDVLDRQHHKLERTIHPRDHTGKLIVHDLIHAKYDPMTLNEVTLDWGHHQLDAVGLFLHMIADLDMKNCLIQLSKRDRKILQLLIFYVQNVRYWIDPDNGMWEECLIRRSSSIGPVVRGLSYNDERGLAIIPSDLITIGKNSLLSILPFESRDRCGNPQHRHDCDAAQLFLIWPYNVVDRETADIILTRIIHGHPHTHTAEYGPSLEFHRLVQPLGVNRYWGDGYYRSRNGISAQWQWDFLISIIYTNRKEYDEAVRWFNRGSSRITAEHCITEAYVDDKPNDHTPLGWMHALAIIAYLKLPDEYKKQII
ncbi:MAG: hypothetical protein HYT37_01040 [Candidatus Sungbacteria bacterium]|nr:hypothetical protein [Candidatus Sungbacteria bacterium]